MSKKEIIRELRLLYQDLKKSSEEFILNWNRKHPDEEPMDVSPAYPLKCGIAVAVVNHILEQERAAGKGRTS